MLVLRTCNKDLKSHNGFQWPESGFVEAPDWRPTKECSYGLHGWAWGEGSIACATIDENSKWLIVDVDDDKVVYLFGMVKFPYGNVIFCGDQSSATKYIIEHGAKGIVIGATIIAEQGIVRVGDYGIAQTGNGGLAEAGSKGIAISGNCGTSNVGFDGVAVSGDFSKINTSDYCKVTAGKHSIIKCGKESVVSAGEGSRIIMEWFNYNKEPHMCTGQRIAVGYIGEDELKPNVKYTVKNGKFTETSEEKNV